MRVIAALSLALLSCGSPARSLIVSLRTDFAPLIEFDEVRLVLGQEPSGGTDSLQTHTATMGDYTRGVRVAVFDGIAEGQLRLRTELLSADGRIIAERESVFESRELSATTVVVTRSCEGVMCPASDPSLTQCAGGRCVDPRCSPETPEFCPLGCIEDSECAPIADCLVGECTTEGTCLSLERAGACGADERCDGVMGCISDLRDAGTPDAGRDAGPMDASTPDTIPDVMPDIPIDVGPCDGGDCCVCEPAEIDTRACGNCGVQTRLCRADCQWDPWGECTGEGVCAAPTEETESCGRCGMRSRICNDSCGWDAWGACTDEGMCSAGTMESCGGGCQARLCSDTCEWGACTACSCTDMTVCSNVCPTDYHIDQRYCQTSCGGSCTSGFPNTVHCEPNCGDEFISCSLSCPAGYYVNARYCISRCGGTGICTAGSNAVECKMTGATTIIVCGNFCPPAYSRTGGACSTGCGSCSGGNNASRCRLD